MLQCSLCFLTLFTLALPCAAQETREQKVRGDRQKVEAAGFWIYNDFAEAQRRAKESGKPILVVLRCIPCEACVKLDDELVDQHPVIRPLLEQFECVRLVATNGLDLNLFQFDTDQSFAVFMLNGDGTIYGRFGTRSHRTDWNGDVSLEGLAEALKGAPCCTLDTRPIVRRWWASEERRPSFPRRKSTPISMIASDRLWTMRDRSPRAAFTAIRSATRSADYYRNREGQFPEKLLFPYPHPKALGLILDPQRRADRGACCA